MKDELKKLREQFATVNYAIYNQIKNNGDYNKNLLVKLDEIREKIKELEGSK